MNLFDLVDQLFRGTVHLAYNFVATAVAIVRNPVRAPWRLVRRHRSKRTEQLSAASFLFLFALVPAALVIAPFADEAGQGANASTAERLIIAFSEPPDINGRVLWQAALVALVWVIFVDVAIRIATLPSTRRAASTRDAMIQAIEFPLCLVAMPFAFAAVAEGEVETAVLGIAAITLYVAALVPSALLVEGFVVRRSMRFRSRRARGVVVASATLFLSGVVLLATRTADDLAYRLLVTPSDAERASNREVEVLGLSCEARPDRLTANFFLWNPTTSPVVIAKQELYVHYSGRLDERTDLQSVAMPGTDIGAGDGAAGEGATIIPANGAHRFNASLLGRYAYGQPWGSCSVRRFGREMEKPDDADVDVNPDDWTPEQRGERPARSSLRPLTDWTALPPPISSPVSPRRAPTPRP